jgi:hypothetical protein
VSGAAGSGDGTSIAYSTVRPGNVGPSTLVVSDAGTRKVRATAQFPTFARVVGYSDSRIVILETDDGGTASVAVWIPSIGQITSLPAYRSVAGVGEGFAVLRKGGGGCPVLVGLSELSVTEPSRPSLDPACGTDRWSLDSDGPSAVGFGTPGSPKPVWASLPDGTMSAFAIHAVDAIWLDRSDIALIDGDGNLNTCTSAGRCHGLRMLTSPTTPLGAEWLIAPLRSPNER